MSGREKCVRRRVASRAGQIGKPALLVERLRPVKLSGRAVIKDGFLPGYVGVDMEVDVDISWRLESWTWRTANKMGPLFLKLPISRWGTTAIPTSAIH